MRLVRIEESNEKARKIYFQSDDGYVIEACLLSFKKHGVIICISSQIGCTQGCTFCASGLSNFVRNISFEEMQEQVALIIRNFPACFENGFEITYMGAGEPLANKEVLLQSMEYFRMHYSNLKKINISTILPALPVDLAKELENYYGKIHIQFSLHFTSNRQRKQYFNCVLPDIEESLDYLDALSKRTGDRYAINYILFDRVNDTKNDAFELEKLAQNRKGYIKISEMSPIVKSQLKKSEHIRVQAFLKELQERNIEYDFFESLGKDVNAGCGQFYNESVF